VKDIERGLIDNGPNLCLNGRDIAQSVSCGLHTAAPGVPRQVMWDLWWTKWHRGRFFFFEYLGFPCQFSFHRLLHIYYHLSCGVGTTDQLVADVPIGHSLNPCQEQVFEMCPVRIAADIPGNVRFLVHIFGNQNYLRKDTTGIDCVTWR
jgi:hypothetical protein